MPLETTWLERGTRDGESRLDVVVLGPDVCTTIDVREGIALLVGREADAQIRLVDRAVSARHARLIIGAGDTMLVEDLGSRNGTFVAGNRIAVGERLALAQGEAVMVGGTTIVLQ